VPLRGFIRLDFCLTMKDLLVRKVMVDCGLRPYPPYACYDAVNNRMTSAHQPGTWNYNQNHQLLSFVAEENKTTYAYNPLGHAEQETMTQNGTVTKQRSYVYNAAERLVEVKDNGSAIAQYQHDPFGRRISKTVNGETIWFQYSDEGLFAEYRNSAPIKFYGWKPHGLWGSEPLWQADIAGSQKSTHYYHVDNLGTSQRLTDKDGNLTWAMQAEAFGRTTTSEAITTENNFRFPGQYFDKETGLYYM
jgi:YD repeat-containing protein